MAHWVSVWGQAHTDISTMSPTCKDSTVRISVRSAVSGTRIRIRLSNRDGKSGYQVKAASVMDQSGNQALLAFHGSDGCGLRPGEEIFSDAAEFRVNGGELLSVSLAFVGRSASGNNITEHVQCSKKGNFVSTPQFTVVRKNMTACLFDMAQAIPALSAVEVLTEDPYEVIVCLGDSITQQGRWTRPLATRLSKQAIVINKGIGGNRLLSDPPGRMMRMYGRSGMERFERDVLGETGVTTLVLSIGTNDLGMARTEAELLTCGSAALEHAFTSLADRARAHGLKVYASTIPPRGGSGQYAPFHEKHRLTFNDWLRGAELFDGVLDFDAAVRDPRRPELLAFPFDSGDHLHPSDLGGEAMAACAAKILLQC